MLQEFVSKLSENEKKVFYVAVIILLAASFDRLFLGPALNKITMLEDEIVSQKSSIKKDLRILTYKDQIQKEKNQYRQYFTDKLEDEDVVNTKILSNIESLASRTKVNLIKSNPSDTLKASDRIEYFTSLECSGALEDVITFMHAINSSEDLLKVVEFNMNPKRGAANEVSASMTIAKMIVGAQPFATPPEK